MGKLKPVENALPELPRAPQRGDRIKLRPERHHAIRQAVEACGYAFEPERIHIVTRIEQRPGGSSLWFERPPFSYYSGDVVLAWNDPQGADRRAALEAVK